MAIIQSGATADLLTVDPTFKAARVTLRPNEMTGSYRAVGVSGTIAAATGAGALFTFKYTASGSGTVAILRRISIGLQVTTLYTQGGIRFSCYHTRASFTQGTTGATALTLTSNNAKKRTSQATTGATAYITTIGLITGDTAAGEDATPFASGGMDLPAVVTTRPYAGLYDLYDGYSTNVYPMVFATTEGFRLKNDTAFAAAGSGNLIVQVEWDEMATY